MTIPEILCNMIYTFIPIIPHSSHTHINYDASIYKYILNIINSVLDFMLTLQVYTASQPTYKHANMYACSFDHLTIFCLFSDMRLLHA